MQKGLSACFVRSFLMVSHPLVRPSSKFKSPHQQCSGRSGPEGNWLRFLVNYEAERSIVGRSSRLLMGTPLTLAVVSVSWSDGKIASTALFVEERPRLHRSRLFSCSHRVSGKTGAPLLGIPGFSGDARSQEAVVVQLEMQTGG